MTSALTNALAINPNDSCLMHVTLDKGLRKGEKVLNVLGYIPIISCFSGAARVFFGKIEVIAAIALGIILALKAVLFSDTAEQRSKQIDYAIGVALNYSLHGVANIGRGLVESMPFVNLGCLIYDLAGKRISYPFERV